MTAKVVIAMVVMDANRFFLERPRSRFIVARRAAVLRDSPRSSAVNIATLGRGA
jgi:hypothetical protein